MAPPPNKTEAPSYVGNPAAVPGKPVVSKFPTPNLADRIFVIRKDARLPGNPLPKPGDKYDGTNPSKLEGFVFATATVADQFGWQDWFYLNERANQDAYNYEIEYPYTDHSFPRYTRTYVLLRSDVVEPTSDDVDPVYNPTVTPGGLNMVLTDHKQLRLQDPILDSLFVGVQRVYERLPGPVITSYGQNEAQQIVTTHTQETLPGAGDPPTSDALTESIKVDAQTLAKQRVAVSKVPDVFPHAIYTKNWGSTYRDPVPLEYRFQNPLLTTQITTAGSASMPNLAHGDISKMETQVTEFKVETQTTRQDVVHTEVQDKKLTEEYGGGRVNINKSLDPGPQNLDEGLTVLDSSVRTLGDGVTEKITDILDGEAWPILHGSKVETDGIYAGIKVNHTKQVVAEGSTGPGGYVEMQTHDKWRSIQIVESVDLSTLPSPKITYGTTHLDLPPTLNEIIGNWTDTGGFETIADDNNQRATVTVSAGCGGAIGVKHSAGYRGVAVARITRTFLSSAPTIGQIPTPLKIIAASGTASLISKHVQFGRSRGLGYAQDSSEGQLHRTTVQIGEFLTGNFTVTNLSHDANNGSYSATSGPYHVTQGPIFGLSSVLTIDMPISTPGALSSGSWMLVEVIVTSWRFGIYVLETIEALIP